MGVVCVIFMLNFTTKISNSFNYALEKIMLRKFKNYFSPIPLGLDDPRKRSKGFVCQDSNNEA